MDRQLRGKLTVSGEGQVKVRPDVANLQLGVVTEAKTAVEALAANGERMNGVLARVKALGVPPADLQTTGLGISPIVDWDEKSPTHGQVVGYRAEDTLAVRAGIALVGKVLDEGVAGGANVAGGLSFGVRDESAHRDRALEAAIDAARHQASVAARAAGVQLGEPTVIDVSWGGAAVVVRTLADRRVAATPVEPGTLTLSATVRMEMTCG